MFWLLFLLCAVIFWSFLLLKWKKTKAYWKERGVPYVDPNPILGNLGYLAKMHMTDFMLEQYKKFKPAPYFGIWWLWKPALVVTKPELARKILVQNFNSFQDRYLNASKDDTIGNLSIFMTNNPLWANVRKRLTVSFTSSKLKAAFPLVNEKGKEVIQRIDKETKRNKKFSLHHMFADCTTDVVGATSFGVAGNATLTGTSPMRLVTRDFQTFSIMRGIASVCIFFVPKVADFMGFHLFPKASVKYFREVFSMVCQQRKDTGHAHNDLLDNILMLKKHFEAHGHDVPEDLLISQAVIFLQGGFDTTANTLTFLCLELANAPEIQEKLYRELCDARDRLGHSEFDSQTISNMIYLDCAVKETLRKWAAMNWIDRMATEDYQLDEHLTIHKGTPVYINVIGMHFDPEYFPDPETFNPDRFLPENKHNIPPFAYLPFGEGPRMCIGARFAKQTILTIMCRILMNYRLYPLDGALTPDQVVIDPKSMFLASKYPIYVGFEERD